MNNQITVLIIEDEQNISNFMNKILTAHGYHVISSYCGRDGLSVISSRCPDVILLDLGLPDMDGMDIIRQVRSWSNSPIIVISARTLEQEKVAALDNGADDYITKPFSLPVLYAKAMALLNRIRGNGTLLKAGRLTVDQNRHKVWNQDRLLELPPKEYAMLLFFLENPGRIYNRDQLLIRFWGYDFDGNERVVDNHIKKLRKILENSGCTITTVRKSGYRMEVEA